MRTFTGWLVTEAVVAPLLQTRTITTSAIERITTTVMRYNFACAISVYLQDKEAALEMLGPLFETINDTFLPYAKADPDLEVLRDDPRFQAMVSAAELRLAATGDA